MIRSRSILCILLLAGLPAPAIPATLALGGQPVRVGEVLFVGRDQGRSCLGGEVVGKGECAGGLGSHGISSDLRSVTLEPNSGAHERG